MGCKVYFERAFRKDLEVFWSFGRVWAGFGASWGTLEAVFDARRRFGDALGMSWVSIWRILGSSWAILKAFWAHLEAILERHGAIFGHLSEVLGASWRFFLIS